MRYELLQGFAQSAENKSLFTEMTGFASPMKNFLLLALTTAILFPTPSQSDTNHFGVRGVFELGLGESEIHLTPRQEREQKLLEDQLKKKEK
tara:strand:- start:325 stop:600 length:276 start_codon:yes stop_codon:yes gene_type:complete